MTEEPAIQVSSLSKQFGDTVAVDGISFSVSEGEIVGIVGSNGAGKTTTLKILAGLISPTEGDVSVAGVAAGTSASKSATGFLPEESPLYDDMTPTSYLAFFADLYDVPSAVANQRINRLLTDLQLNARNQPLGEMSKGMRRKVALSRALINDPSVLIFDEPASGLDPETTEYVMNYICRLKEEGKAIVLSAHDLFNVESVCDRVLMFDQGTITERGSVESLSSSGLRVAYHMYTDSKLNRGGGTTTARGYEYTVYSMEAVSELQSEANEQGVSVTDIRTEEPTLKDAVLGETHSESEGVA